MALRASLVGIHTDASTRRARAAFVAWRGPVDVVRRAEEIASLPVIEWKGKTLYALRCVGTSGKGPHTVNVPESLLWTLIRLDDFLCPFHTNDRWLREAEA